MIILLGVFNSSTFKFLYELNQIGNERILPYQEFIHLPEWRGFGSICECVKRLCLKEKIKQIYFSLDQLKFPYCDESISCRELDRLINEPKCVEKLVFWQDFSIVDKKEVLNFLTQNFYSEMIPDNFPQFTKINKNESKSTVDY